MSLNPSHILIARNSRGVHNPSASLSSPIETHAAAAGIFRSSTVSPSWAFEETEADDIISEISIDSDDSAHIDVDPAFARHGKFPGTVKIVVESTVFWAHKEVLYFASPFFEAALSGDWAETGGRPESISSVITITQPPDVPGEDGERALAEATSERLPFHPADCDAEPEEPDMDDGGGGGTEKGTGEDGAGRARAIASSLGKLEGASARSSMSSDGRSTMSGPQEKDSLRTPRASPAKPARRTKEGQCDAVIVLKEERAYTFHEFLKFVYPSLECTISWANVEGLMNIAHKLCVPTLQRACLSFLLSHAAGRPLKAMRIAELFEEEELYREGSRFVLDNPGGWSDDEMYTLSRDTLLKLEKRRTWFLERVLKLGLVQMAKEYQCCPSCPDSTTCARLLDEKWRQSYHAVFRFGPCQPSMVYRYLRSLEGISPPLSLTHLACQTTAKAFVATLFDRMFSLGVRGSGTDTAPVSGGLVGRVAGLGATPGPRRHFLYCSLKGDIIAKKDKRATGLPSST